MDVLNFAHELGVVCVQHQGDFMRSAILTIIFVFITFFNAQSVASDSQSDAFMELKLDFINEMNIHSLSHYYHQQDFILEKQYLRLSAKYYQYCIASDIEESKCEYFQRDFILGDWTTSETETRTCRVRKFCTFP